MKIRLVTPESAPLALLLLADPSVERVQEYLQTGTIFVGEDDDQIVAVAVLDLKASDAELKNIAVAENRQGNGLGRQMLARVLKYAAEAGVNRVVVGTGNSSLPELAFYQKNGFRIIGVIPGFFDNYHPQIIENGIVCRDMIRLEIDLKRNQPLDLTFAPRIKSKETPSNPTPKSSSPHRDRSA